MDLNTKLIVNVLNMENTASTIDLSCVFTQESALQCDNKKEFFDEKKMRLKTFLSSSGQQYNIVQYQKDWLTKENMAQLGLFRSVVFNQQFELLSFAPPKSAVLMSQDINSSDIHAEEFIEGTMINMFYDKRIENWEISTRSTIGGNVKFYRHSPETFQTMFYNTWNELNLSHDALKKDHCYSFILQHKGNRIVVPIEKNHIYLAESYKITGPLSLFYSYDHSLIEKYPFLKINNLEKTSFESMQDTYAKSGHTDYKIMGVVFKNASTGLRMKMRNPEYEAVRKLRGNQCKDQYNYLCLRKDGNMASYLKFYPEDKKRFSVYRDLVHKATKDLYSMYQDCYIYKKAELKTFPSEFRTHMYKLHHEIYLMKLKPTNISMQFTNVKDYVNNMHASLLMSMINRNANHVLTK